ncbi:MAG: helix-turn-helix domain-containing protein [Ignavibacterium sp.]|nr:helix-turn-helix domain-containing protein [Ignavibacterium sp.]
MSRENEVRLAKFLQSKLQERHISIRSLADRAGVSFSHLSKVLRADVPVPQPAFLDKVAAALHVPFTAIFLEAGYLCFDDACLDEAREIVESYSVDSFSYETLCMDILQKYNIELNNLNADLLFELSKRSKIDADFLFYFFKKIPTIFSQETYTKNFSKIIKTFRKGLNDYFKNEDSVCNYSFWSDIIKFIREEEKKEDSSKKIEYVFSVQDKGNVSVLTISLSKDKMIQLLPDVSELIKKHLDDKE